jgi:hypothetical protein
VFNALFDATLERIFAVVAAVSHSKHALNTLCVAAAALRRHESHSCMLLPRPALYTVYLLLSNSSSLSLVRPCSNATQAWQ